MHKDQMNTALVVFYLLALVDRGDPNSLPRSLNGSALNNSVSVSVCIGGAVSLPVIRERQPCTDGRQVLITPGGRRIARTTGRYAEKDGTWIISNVKRSDSGMWISQWNCNEGKTTLRVNLKVNCESLTVYTGDQLALQCQKPTIPQNSTDIEMEIHCELATKPGQDFIVLKDGKIKDDKKIFGGRAKVGADDHTLIINKLRKSDTGNYTCMWRWVDAYHKTSRKYTYHVNVTVGTEPLTTTHAPTTNGTATPTVIPTGGKSPISRGGSTKAIQCFLPLLVFLIWIA